MFNFFPCLSELSNWFFRRKLISAEEMEILNCSRSRICLLQVRGRKYVENPKIADKNQLQSYGGVSGKEGMKAAMKIATSLA